MVCINPNPHNKMERLTIKELVPYLPYELKFVSSMDKPLDEYGKQPIWTLNGISEMFGDYCLLTKENNDAYGIVTCKPLLGPLSSLTEEEHYTKLAALVGAVWFNDEYQPYQFIHELVNGYIERGLKKSHFTLQYLYENHFDVAAIFNHGVGLIDRGLALPIDGKEVEGE